MRFRRNNYGQSLVETAIVLPLVILLLMGMIDFGLLLNHYIVISNASREAARKASLGGTDAEILTQVQNLTTILDDTKLNVHISPSESCRNQGVEVAVSIEYQNRLITPVIGSLLGSDIPLKSRVTMRVE